MSNDLPQITDEVWVNTPEANQITGYYRDHLQRLARNNWNLPENERLIRVRKRANRYELWLPDLVNYIKNYGAGPNNRKPKFLDSDM